MKSYYKKICFRVEDRFYRFNRIPGKSFILEVRCIHQTRKRIHGPKSLIPLGCPGCFPVRNLGHQFSPAKSQIVSIASIVSQESSILEVRFIHQTRKRFPWSKFSESPWVPGMFAGEQSRTPIQSCKISNPLPRGIERAPEAAFLLSIPQNPFLLSLAMSPCTLKPATNSKSVVLSFQNRFFWKDEARNTP